MEQTERTIKRGLPVGMRIISEHKVVGIWRSEIQKNKGEVVSEYYVEVDHNRVGNKLHISKDEYDGTNVGDIFQVAKLTEKA